MKQTTRQGALETRGLWEKQPWVHSLGPFPAGPAALTEPSLVCWLSKIKALLGGHKK